MCLKVSFFRFSKNIAGRLGEYIAIICYVLRLYNILGYRVRSRVGEIDLICQRFNTIVFVEVKTRKDKNFDDKILLLKQRTRIQKAAELFISRNPQYAGFDLRFDLVIIYRYCIPRIIKNAW